MSLKTIKYLLIDMDGVLYRGKQPMAGLTGFFTALHERDVGFRLVSNNSVTTTQQYIDKMDAFGVSITSEHLVTSAYATADWLEQKMPKGARIYAIGEDGINTALSQAGFVVSNGHEPPEKVEAVVAGLSFSIDYLTLHHAARLIRNGALFIGTNPDPTIPTPDGIAPGAGSILAAIQTASGVEPTVIGKPNKAMFEQALNSLGARPDETAMVGDRLETDILGGQRAGLKTILVLSGVARAEDVDNGAVKPTWIFENIKALAAALDSGFEVEP